MVSPPASHPWHLSASPSAPYFSCVARPSSIEPIAPSYADKGSTVAQALQSYCYTLQRGAAPFFSISLLWLGWTNYPSTSYWSGYAAIVVFGFSMTAIFVSSYIYIINSYGTWSSSALGSITLARYFVSSGMVVASRPMYEGIGVHWTLTLLGALGAVLVPTPYLISRYGGYIRRKSKFAVGGTEDES